MSKSKALQHDASRCGYQPCMDCRRAAYQTMLAEAAAFEARVAGTCQHITPCSFPEGSIEAYRYPATTCGAYVLKGATTCVAGHQS